MEPCARSDAFSFCKWVPQLWVLLPLYMYYNTSMIPIDDPYWDVIPKMCPVRPPFLDGYTDMEIYWSRYGKLAPMEFHVMIVVQWIHDYCAENTFAMDSHVVSWLAIVSNSMPSGNLRWGSTSPQLCPWMNMVSCPCVSVAEVSQRGYCNPSAHIPLLSRMTGVKCTTSALPWSIKLSSMTPSFGWADLFCWVDVYRS